MQINYSPLVASDIPELTSLMTEAFDDESIRYNGGVKGGPPGYDDGSFLQKWAIENEESLAFKIIAEGKLVGAFIIWWDKNGESTLGNIFISPQFQNRGIGTSVWNHIEKSFPTQKWSLETPVWSIRNHFFYESNCGFTKCGAYEDTICYEKVKN